MNEPPIKSDPMVEFETVMAGTGVAMGADANGWVIFTFFTPEGQPNFTTKLGPSLTAQVASQLMFAVSNIPRLDAALGAALPRKRPPKAATDVHFGQGYPAEVLQALGLLMVRVNLLERSLIKLLSAVSQTTAAQSEALFYSTLSMKARIDMIASLAGASGLNDHCSTLIDKALNRAKSVNGQRNDLVHGHWTLNNDNFRVETIQPGRAARVTSQTVTRKSLEALAVDYRSAGLLVEGAASTLVNTRDMAR